MVLNEVLTWPTVSEPKGHGIMVVLWPLVSKVLLITVLLQGEVHWKSIRSSVTAIALNPIRLGIGGTIG